MPKCLLCGKHVKIINGLHLKSHRMTTAEYREKFPEAVMTDVSFRAKRSEAQQRIWADRSDEEKARIMQPGIDGIKASWTPERRATQAESAPEMVAKIWSDPAKRGKMSARRQATALEMWERDDYRKQMLRVHKWTKPEKVVRGWLQEEGWYMSGHDGRIGFLPHRWLPLKGAGFSSNGDFVDYNNRLIIHVDGWHHRAKEWVKQHDRKTDAWCPANDWLFLRLTDIDIDRRPDWCKDQIRALISSSLLG